MRVGLTGASGLVGSHPMRAFGRGQSPSYDAECGPDAIVHAAILNDFDRLEREGWDAYAGFGKFVAALVPTLRAGERFTVWEREVLGVELPALDTQLQKLERSTACWT